MPQYRVKKVDKTDELSLGEFDCGVSKINALAKDCYFESLIKQGQGYVLTDGERLLGVGLYRFVNVKNYTDTYQTEHYNRQFGAIKLEYLGVDSNIHGNKLGTHMLKLAVKMAKLFSLDYPLRFLEVDALPQVVEWYEKNGFSCYCIESDDKHKMFMDLISVQDLEKLKSYEE